MFKSSSPFEGQSMPPPFFPSKRIILPGALLLRTAAALADSPDFEDIHPDSDPLESKIRRKTD